MRFGIRIPSLAWPDLTYQETRAARAYCQRIEVLGFDSIWVIDHLLPSPKNYVASWLEPLSVLSFVAACTERVKLGTSILVLPLRHPVRLAKEIATLDSLSAGRFILGVGSGWDEKEFAAMRVRLEERGARTDEVLGAVRALLTRTNVTHRGKFFQFEDLTIYPRPPKMVPVWIGGGSATRAPGTREKPYLVDSLLRRIASADAWMCRSTGGDKEGAKRDWAQITAYAASIGRRPSDILFSATQWLHIVDTADREKALKVQRPLFERIMGTYRSFDEHMRDSYLTGTVDDMVNRIRELQEVGLQYMILNPLTYDPEQLDLIWQHIVSAFPDGQR